MKTFFHFANYFCGSFIGLDVANHGILMTTDYQGRSSGEAFVLFESADSAEAALKKNRQSIGHRWDTRDSQRAGKGRGHNRFGEVSKSGEVITGSGECCGKREKGKVSMKNQF